MTARTTRGPSATGCATSRISSPRSVTHSTAVNGTISRIQPTLSPGAVVTTHKNLVDKVVTEHGVAELRGRTIRQRALALIAIAAPPFRDDLRAAARDLAYL
jgi:acyl-CoA hydrolase